MRVRRFSGVLVLAIGLGFTTGPTGAGAADDVIPPLVTSLQTLLDGAGDVVDTTTSGVLDNPRADIAGASLEYAPGWIRMKVQLKNTTDPLKDKSWSDRSDAEWLLDTNGDGMPEYSVEFATDDGQLYGAVFDVSKPDSKSLCDADSASFNPEDGYVLVIDPACIGKPQKLGYAVAIFFDTDPNKDDAPIATDRTPDQGFKEVAAPAQPGETPPRAPASADTSTAPAVAPPAAPSPTSTRRVPTAGPRAAASAPKTGAGGSAPAGAAGPVSEPGQSAPVPPPSSPLARTGSATADHGFFGLGILLVGAGILVMTRRGQRPNLGNC